MLIGEVAKKSGLSKDGIRHYESLGLLHSKPIQAGSRTYRDYDDTTLERLMIISLAKRLHFSLKELVDPLNQILSDTISREERAAGLAEKVKEIDVKIAELTAARDLLKVFVENPDKSFVDAGSKKWAFGSNEIPQKNGGPFDFKKDPPGTTVSWGMLGST